MGLTAGLTQLVQLVAVNDLPVVLLHALGKPFDELAFDLVSQFGESLPQLFVPTEAHVVVDRKLCGLGVRSIPHLVLIFGHGVNTPRGRLISCACGCRVDRSPGNVFPESVRLYLPKVVGRRLHASWAVLALVALLLELVSRC